MKPFLVAALMCVIVAVFMGWMTGAIPSEAKYCSANQQTKQEDYSTYNIALVALIEAGKFLDKASAGLSALATAIIAWFTITLARVGRQQGEDTREALRITRDSANAAIESNKLTREALIAEYRPRFKVTMTPLRDTLEFDKAGDLNLKIRVVGRNVGRGVAFGATIPWIVNYQTDGKDVQAKIDGLRKSASQWVEFLNHPTYAEEEIEREFSIKIFKHELERTWLPKADTGLINYYIITSLFYRDGFNPPNIYESTPAGYLTFFGPMAPFPRDAAEFDTFSRGQRRESLTIHELQSKYT